MIDYNWEDEFEKLGFEYDGEEPSLYMADIGDEDVMDAGCFSMKIKGVDYDFEDYILANIYIDKRDFKLRCSIHADVLDFDNRGYDKWYDNIQDLIYEVEELAFQLIEENIKNNKIKQKII